MAYNVYVAIRRNGREFHEWVEVSGDRAAILDKYPWPQFSVHHVAFRPGPRLKPKQPPSRGGERR